MGEIKFKKKTKKLFQNGFRCPSNINCDEEPKSHKMHWSRIWLSDWLIGLREDYGKWDEEALYGINRWHLNGTKKRSNQK